MAYYPKKVAARSRSPRFASSLPEGSASGIAVSFECGTFVRVFLSIEPTDNRISDAGFLSNGCGFAVAAADVIVEILCGKSLPELNSMRDGPIIAAVAGELGEFPPNRIQCLDLTISAVREALADHRVRCIEEFRGEAALVCTCFGVTEETVQEIIAASRPESIDEVADQCSAGSGCGSGRMLVEEMLGQVGGVGRP